MHARECMARCPGAADDIPSLSKHVTDDVLKKEVI
jgi:hypothetical protein